MDNETKSAEAMRDLVFGAQAQDTFAFVLWEGVGRVKVYSLSVAERDKFDRETRRREKKTPDKLRVKERLLIATVRDLEGKPLFTALDEDRLSTLPTKIVDSMFAAACRENGYSNGNPKQTDLADEE